MLCRVRSSALAGAVSVFALVSLAPVAGQAASESVLRDTYHQDHRSTPRVQFNPVWESTSGSTGQALALDYLAQRADTFGLPTSLDNLQLTEVQESLLGHHYRFQQQIEGIDVDRAEVIVSIAKKDGAIYRVFNNTYPRKDVAALETMAALDEEAALDAAWNRLRVHGEVTAEPAARLVWTPEGEGFRLNWIVLLEVAEPFGAWQVRVDATTGNVVETEDTSLYRVADEFTTAPLSERIDSYTGPIADRRETIARFLNSRAQQRAAGAAGVLASGTGTVFDPDPRTALQDDNLQDGSPASAFTAAYVTRNLLDITLNAGTYSLTGPWIDIINFESPATAPSTTTTGNWTAVRGNNAFNDALTYFHIDQNQRYMQSLGFTGGTGIQFGPIGTDTDGLSGADNSHYIPGSNRMAFGHGCVDDSEDADVVLHEYGHAINYSINSSWSGGDTGAMGEGFGDYWAGSYSYSTLNGDTYHPEWVFTWDGHGTGNQCWNGRIMNAFAAQYVHTTFYSAHSSIPGGFQSDELWSTPLFQTLLALDGLGETRDSVDQIILEAQFGQGSGMKMRDMANAIIQAAGLLQPAGPHADTFTQKFLVHNIVDVPFVSLAATDLPLTSAGPNNAADPGETVLFKIDMTNQGTLGATAISGVLSSSTPGVVINQGSSTYPDLGAGASALSASDFSITLPPGHTCGDPVDLSLLVDYDDGAPKQTTLTPQLGTGVAQGASVSASPALAIPDNNPTGVSSSLVVSGTGANVSANLNIDIDITHTWIGDLIVTLQAPSGTQVVLHNRTGSSTDDIVGNYPGTLTPAGSLASLIGGPLDGTWKLTVSDNAGADLGTLNSWGVNDVSGYVCDSIVTDVIADLRIPSKFALETARPNPFRSAATIRFAVPGQGAEVSLDIFDVSGRHVRTLQNGFVAPGHHSVTWSGQDDAGRPAGAGVYFYRLESADFRETKKVMLVK